VPDPDAPAFLTSHPFAHRGLHDRMDRLENGLSAFAAARDAGQGMECDVRASADGIAFVFHDATLERLTAAAGEFSARTAAELDVVALKSGRETVPRLSALLALVAGKTPLLIEIKSPDGSIYPICRAVAKDIAPYDGPVAIMSFNPMICRWFYQNAPAVVRGLVVTEEGKKGLRGRLERDLALRWARPHFLAYDIRDLPCPFPAAARRKGLPVLTWTVRSDAQRAVAAEHADQVIHELPALGGAGPAQAGARG